MPWNTIDIERRLREALNTFNWSQAEQICRELINEIYLNIDPFPEDAAKRLLNNLRRKRQFKLMSLLAEAFIRAGLRSPLILRQYSQSLIDQGLLTAPEFVLDSIIANSPGNKVEVAEASGLIGRIYKQLYINANAPDTTYSRNNLNKALEAYWNVYNLQPQETWHGINAVALLKRAQRDRIPLQNAPNARLVAEQIIQTINERSQYAETLPPWDVATRLEAFIASGDYDLAEVEAAVYVNDDRVDAFELGSTLRQLEEMWQLNDHQAPGDKILPILRGALASRSGTVVTVDPTRIVEQQKNLEKVFGNNKSVPVTWLSTLLERGKSVVRLERRGIGGRGVGTGWVVNGGDFFRNRAGQQMIITNAHVVNRDGDGGALTAAQAQVNFQAFGKVLEVEQEIVWSSPYQELDATFLTLKGEVPEAAPLKLADTGVRMNQPPPLLYIMGHPGGRDMEYSFQDNYLLGVNETRLHYRTPTEPGSSGSPVFEADNLLVVALHHAGSNKMKRLDDPRQTYEANEGISIQAIRQATLAA